MKRGLDLGNTEEKELGEELSINDLVEKQKVALKIKAGQQYPESTTSQFSIKFRGPRSSPGDVVTVENDDDELDVETKDSKGRKHSSSRGTRGTVGLMVFIICFVLFFFCLDLLGVSSHQC